MKAQVSKINNLISTVTTFWKKIKPKQAVSEEHESEVMHESAIEIQDRNHIRGISFIFWFAGVLIVYIGYLLYSSLDLIYLIFTGYILSMATDKMVTRFQKLTGSRGWGIFLSYFIFIAVLLSGVLIMVPFLAGQIGDIGSILLKTISSIQNELQTKGLESIITSSNIIPSIFKENIISSVNGQDTSQKIIQLIQQNIQQIISTSSVYIQGAGGIAVTAISAILNALTQVGFVFTLAVLFSVEKDNMMKLINRFDKRHHSNRHHKINQMYNKLGFWLTSQLILCLFIFAMTLIGLGTLALFGFKLPSIFSLAIIAGLTEMIPYVGPLLGSVPALLVGTLNHGLAGFVGVGILFFIIQWTENNILIPWIMNKTLGVSSLLIFICMLIGASVFGFLGIILAVPIAIIISISTEE